MSTQQIPRKLNLAPKSTPLEDSVRTLTSVQSDRQTYSPGQRAYIDLPSLPSNLKGSWLQFNAQATASTTPGPGAVDAFLWPIGSIIERVRVLMGSQVIEDISNYQLLHGCLSNLYSGSLIPGQAIEDLAMEGNFAQATRAVDSLDDNTYSIKLFCDSLRQFYPLDKINGQFRIEITWAQPSFCMVSDAVSPNPDYTVSQVLFYYNNIRLPAAIDQQIAADIAGSNYKIYCKPFKNFTDTSVGAATRGNLSIPARFSNVSKLLSIARENGDINDFALDFKTSKYDTTINGLSSLTLRVNNDYIPSDRLPSLAQDASERHYVLFRMFCDAFTDLSGVNTRAYNAICATDWKNASYQVMCFDLREDPSNPALVNNGRRLNAPGAMCVLEFNLDAGYTSCVVDSFICYQLELTVSNGGNMVITS